MTGADLASADSKELGIKFIRALSLRVSPDLKRLGLCGLCHTMVASLPTRHDGKHGRLWGRLGDRHRAVRVLSSDAFYEWLRTPQPLPRVGSKRARVGTTRLPDVLEQSAGSNDRLERQLVIHGSDVNAFVSGARYSPLLASQLNIPREYRDAMFDVMERVASARYGENWRSVIRLLSVQPTLMKEHNVRGNHVDPPKQGDYIATYTARGSADIMIDYQPDEVPEDGAPFNPLRSGVQQLVRLQVPGCYYGISDESREDPCMHGVNALADGRVSITYRFVFV